MTSAVMVAAGLICGIAVAVAWQTGALAQSANARRVIRPANAPNIGLPFSPGVLAGNTLYISGHLGRDPATNALVGGGVEAETRQSLANIREVLRAAGMDFKDVTTVTAYITSSALPEVQRDLPGNIPQRSTGAGHRAGGGAERRRAGRVADDRSQALTRRRRGRNQYHRWIRSSEWCRRA
jgi:enamine deaminase RidA (YjgF/YER057c/UK114 family)